MGNTPRKGSRKTRKVPTKPQNKINAGFGIINFNTGESRYLLPGIGDEAWANSFTKQDIEAFQEALAAKQEAGDTNAGGHSR